jgi:hypothetical protein
LLAANNQLTMTWSHFPKTRGKNLPSIKVEDWPDHLPFYFGDFTTAAMMTMMNRNFKVASLLSALALAQVSSSFVGKGIYRDSASK